MCTYLIDVICILYPNTVLYTIILTHLHSYIHFIHLYYSYLYPQLTLANVEAGETPITYKIATKSVPEWLQITPMLGMLRSLPTTMQHLPLYNTPHFAKISHFTTLLFLGTLRSGESIDITIHINHNIANDIKKNEYQNLHCSLIIQYFIYTSSTNANNNNTTSASQNTAVETENAIFSLSSRSKNDVLSNPVPVPPPLNIQQQPQQGQPQQQYTQQHQQQQYTPPSSLYSSKEQPLLLSPSYKGALTPRSSVKYTTTTLDNNTTSTNSNSNTNSYTNTNTAHTSNNNNNNTTSSITKSPQKIIDKITVTDPPLCNTLSLPTDLSVSETLLYCVDKLIIPILYGICQVDGKSTS